MMDWHVFGLVMLAALLHASWNALVKRHFDPLLGITLLQLSCALIVLPLAPFIDWSLRPAAWGWLALSTIIHTAYYWTLSEAYRAGDLSQVYPIARGTAPLLTAAGTTLLIGEWLSQRAAFGLLALVIGIGLLSRAGRLDARALDQRAVGFALLTALTIATYSIVDGLGARAAGSALTYIVLMNLSTGLTMLAVGLWRFGSGGLVAAADKKTILTMLGGGAMGVGAYGIALWAMTVAPIALVAAMRETSVLFAAIIGVVVLREPLVPARVVAAGLVVTGLGLLRFG